MVRQSRNSSLGLVLYDLASGKKSFQRGSTAEIMTAIICEDAEFKRWCRSRTQPRITELSFHGIPFPSQAKKCNPCLRNVLLPMSRVAHFRFKSVV